MTPPTDMRRGVLLRLYLLASHGFSLIAGPVLRRRLRRGKEHPTRWVEKCGHTLAPRPDGSLIWLHAVGLGEVLSLRGLIVRLADTRPDLSFLVTSTTKISAQVFAQNLPHRTIHQFLPIDAPAFRRRFLDHFKPDLCLWAEQDIWPGFVSDMARRGIPQAIIAARMNDTSFRSHQRAGRLYPDIYGAMEMVTAQDEISAGHLAQLGAPEPVAITGSLKPAAPVLDHDPAELQVIRDTLVNRTIWAVAPSHPADEAIARVAHDTLRQSDPTALLIIAPRFPEQPGNIGPEVKRRSTGALPGPDDPTWLFDTFGDLGLVYRLASAVLIGGTFSAIEGHNPWEAAMLNTAILHGPNTSNFKVDFARLDAADAAKLVTTADAVVAVLRSPDLPKLVAQATGVLGVAAGQTDALAQNILTLLGSADD